MPSQRTIDQADTYLDNLITIAKAEQVAHVGYVGCNTDPFNYDPDLAMSGAICGGHKACLVGSLFLGAKVPVTIHANAFRLLEAQNGYRRDFFLSRRPALRLALDVLDKCALRRINYAGAQDDWLDAKGSWSSAAEFLFEDVWEDLDGKDVQPRVVRLAQSAKRELAKLRD